MAKSVLITRVALGVLIVLFLSGLAVWVTRLPSINAYLPAPSNLSSVVISQPADGGMVFLKDLVPVDVQAATRAEVDHFELWINGLKGGTASGKPAASERFMYSVAIPWNPDATGEFTLVVRAVGAGWTEDSNAVRVSVVDPAALMVGPTYLPQAGDTLNTVADKFNLPPLALGIANPKIPGLDDPLPSSQPVNIPNLPPAPLPGQPPSGPSSDLPSGAAVDPAASAPNDFSSWFDINLLTRLKPVQHLPTAPWLLRSWLGCDVNLYIRDNSDNELGFFIYRLDPGASDFTRIATLGPHKGLAFIEYDDKGLYGKYQYYASAYNALGEAASDPTAVVINDSSCAKTESMYLKLTNLHLTPAVGADKAYCYYSTRDGSWSRLPADPNAFVYPAGGNDFDLGSQLPGTQALPPQTKLQFNCWGWRGGALTPLGSGSLTVGDSAGKPLEVKGDNFALTGSLSSFFAPPISHIYKDPPIIMPPKNLTSTAYLDVCVNHFPPPLEFLGGLFCKAAVDSRSTILVWDWSPEPLSVSDIDGYHIYKTYPGGKPALIKTINDRTQTVLIQPPEPAGKAAPCYFARAYKGTDESSNSNTYCRISDIIVYVSSPVKTVSLSPVAVYTQDWLDYDKPTFGFCKEGLGGDAMFALKDGQFASGYEYSYDSSRCTEWIDHIYRGRLVFDVSGIKGAVTSATLYYTQAATDSGDYLFPQSCADTVNLITLTSGDDANTWRLISNLPKLGESGSKHSADVTEAVQSWVLGEDSNLGFLFRGRDETLPRKSNDVCWSDYGGFSLAVTYYTLSK
jgi:hypothetical protein